MGCGSSGNVVPPEAPAAEQSKPNGNHQAQNGSNGNHQGQNGSNGNHQDDDDGVSTVVLPDTPAKPKKPPISFEIPLEEFEGSRKASATPPPHLQRLLQPKEPDISLPDIEEKLAEAEIRRQTILQQRAASAQKRAQKMMKSLHEMDRLESDHEPMESNKHSSNSIPIPPEPGVCEDKNI